MTERIPFDVAISDPKLLQKHWNTLSAPQKVILKAYNGLELSEQEILIWSMLQGHAIYDELGYPIKIDPIPYSPKQYDTLIAILGRRSGKTDRITATQMAYEATLGGHMNYVEPGQDVQILFIAQDVDMAASHLNFVNNALRSSPLMAKEIEKFNSDALVLKNGLKIVPAPPTIKSSRGLAVPGWCGDEVGFWYTDAKAANPDYEVERAVEYAMSQFPHSFKFITSTPYTKQGMLWDAHQAGTEGKKLSDPEDRIEHEGVLVVHAPTAAMQNPRMNPKRFKRLQKKDPEAYVRESLAQFVDSISGFLKPEVLKAAVVSKRLELPRFPRPGHPDDPTPVYVAAMDPAFRHDKFAFTIFHHDHKDGIVQDYFQEWTPELGIPLNPSVVLAEIKLKLDAFGISMIYSDQYQLESLQQLALGMNFTIIGVDFTATSKSKIYGSFASLVNQRRLKLLDIPEMYDQLVSLEKKRSAQGNVSISAPPNKYDDAAAAIALCVHQCLWLLPTLVAPKARKQTLVEEGLAQILKRRREAAGEFDDPEDDDYDMAA